MSYEKREVFEYAPLALVVAEARFAYSPKLAKREVLNDIAIGLEELLPVVEPGQEAEIQVGSPTLLSEHMVLMNIAHTKLLRLSPVSLSLQVTEYEQFKDFSDLFVAACDALVACEVSPVIERLGLRYIDEIRVPEPIQRLEDWSAWVDPRLVTFTNLLPGTSVAQQTQAAVSAKVGEGTRLTFRFGAQDGPPIVDAQLADMRVTKQQPRTGPFFVLDVDAYRDYGDSRAGRLDPSLVERVLSELHDPAGTIFQQALTDQARDLFRTGTTE